jgi:hypothetical protein
MLLVLCGICAYQYSKLSVIPMEEAKAEEEEAPGTAILTGNNKEAIIRKDTKYVLEKYNAADYTLTEEEINVPVEMLGLSRTELIDYLKRYEESPTLEDINRGFLSVEVISFSDDKIIIRKNYEGTLEDDALKEDCYILVSEKGYVSVYLNDYNTFYTYTDIKTNDLPEDLRQEIMDGKILNTAKELYNFLETYTS